jgi:hypothetical protein
VSSPRYTTPGPTELTTTLRIPSVTRQHADQRACGKRKCRRRGGSREGANSVVLLSFGQAQLTCHGQAFLELSKGERTATALEKQLTDMEAKIEALLAQAEKDQMEVAKSKGRQQSAVAGVEDKRESEGSS